MGLINNTHTRVSVIVPNHIQSDCEHHSVPVRKMYLHLPCFQPSKYSGCLLKPYNIFLPFPLLLENKANT